MGLIPPQVLYLNTGKDAFAVWRTPAKRIRLLFDERLNIASGEAAIPALIWKATRKQVQLFAVCEKRTTENTKLCHAPFFNIYTNGRVCMGNVKVQIPPDCSIEDFMRLWESYFFNSYFTHLLEANAPVKGNVVQLWQELIGTPLPFPKEVLKNTPYTLKNLLQ